LGFDGLGFWGGRVAINCKTYTKCCQVIEILRLSGYFIQLLCYTAAVDGDIDT